MAIKEARKVADTRVQVNKRLIDWALATTDLPSDVLADIQKRNKWLQVDFKHYLQPTVKQLGLFARRLHVPFGNLLMDEPPKEEDIRLAFRTQENVPAQVSLTLRDIIYEMQRKQDWFKHESGVANQQLTFVGAARGASASETQRMMARFIALHHAESPRHLYKDLRAQLSQLGVLNMQKGGAGFGTNRPLNVSEARAFVLLDDYAPLIFINQKDSYTARIFSLIHEFGHILHGTDELLKNLDSEKQEEQLINKATAAFLMPEQDFIRRVKEYDIRKAARFFNVSPLAAAIRAQGLGLIDHVVPEDFTEQPVASMDSTGGNPYNNALSLNDNRYMNTLVAAQERGAVQPTEAASLMGISYKMMDRTIEKFIEREVLT
ncbi:DNA-binding protein [Lacticaseibacillus casei]|uniref:DNA-binding protein n=1 Tax=Lacticaseibacillus casei TaxID=1582 RepID=A0AAN1KFE7_LACCA|nr:DNA-binding protein [Lacticaseibacillus casei]